MCLLIAVAQRVLGGKPREEQGIKAWRSIRREVRRRENERREEGEDQILCRLRGSSGGFYSQGIRTWCRDDPIDKQIFSLGLEQGPTSNDKTLKIPFARRITWQWFLPDNRRDKQRPQFSACGREGWDMSRSRPNQSIVHSRAEWWI